MRKIIYTRPDGGVSIVHPVRNTIGENLTSDDEIEKRAWDKLPADAINPRFVDASEIPADRTFRDAWVDSSGKIGHDMDKCRAMHKNRIRELRAPKLAALDVEYQRADEDGDLKRKKVIASQKKALRDATADPKIYAAQTIEELKAAIPEILK